MDAFHLSRPSPALLQVGDADGGADGNGDGPFQLLDLLLSTSDADQAASSAAARAGQESGGRGGAGLTGPPEETSGGIGLASSSSKARAGEESGGLLGSTAHAGEESGGHLGSTARAEEESGPRPLGLAGADAETVKYDDMMKDLKLFSKAHLTSYGKRWSCFTSYQKISMELDIREMLTRRYGPVTKEVWTGLWARLHSNSICRSSPRGSRSSRYRSRSPIRSDF